ERRQLAPLNQVRNHHDQERRHQAERDQRHLLPATERTLGFLDGQEIDANHLSPGRRTDMPSATANSEARRCNAAPSTDGDSAIRLNGSVTSTGASTRSASRVASSGVWAAPPLRYRMSMRSSVA